jgi:hypothetical protein
LKPASLTLPVVAIALFTGAIFAVTAVAQAPQQAAPPHEEHEHHDHPAPTNLKVLPKTMTGEQVHELMETWEGSLGAHCDTCHTADPKSLAPNGRPRLNFADDSKPKKETARLMYKMTNDINQNYVSMVGNAGEPPAQVTCGTCHRGHLKPEQFVIPDDDHSGPRRPEGQPKPAEKTEPPK